MARLKSPLPPDSERKRCRRVRIRGSERISSDGCRLTLLDDLASRGRLPGLGQPGLLGRAGLSPLDPSSVPDDRESTLLSLVDQTHFDRCWGSAIADWESSPNKVGSADDIDKQEGRDMVEAAINLHLDEVQSCMESEGAQLWAIGDQAKGKTGPLPMVSVNGTSLTQQRGGQLHGQRHGGS